ncbi:pentapeptide repeat-containing protein [Streptomyces sp. NPDC005349]|uniref:pentapeptide repeat-containing protein n=1 Tax=Streptomyces sp. NPDC005349 TaxID=3157037 RepID=UPI0033BEEF52
MTVPPPPASTPSPQSGGTFEGWSEALECRERDCSGRRLAVWNTGTRRWEPISTNGAAAESCLHHAAPAQREAYFNHLTPGAPVDLHGTTLTAETLQKLRQCLQSCFGPADFGEATFPERANLHQLMFTRHAIFAGATFAQDVYFGGTTFTEHAYFGYATFDQHAYFGAATFIEAADFRMSRFRRGWVTEGMRCVSNLDLSGAQFNGPVDVNAKAREVRCTGTRWEHSVTLRLSGAHEVNLAYLVSGRRAATRLVLADMVRNVDYPFLVLAPDQFLGPGETLSQSEFDGTGDMVTAARAVTLEDLSGTDLTRMVLTNVDVSRAEFLNALNLDQIRLEGRCRYLRTPRPDWSQRRPWRCTARNIIAAEDTWRRSRSQSGTTPAESGATHESPVAQPGSLAPVYRYLRKSLEDGKDEPGAADFYYGEMEMRRLDGTRPRAERWLLALYWAISGYGLRATRAVCALLAVMGLCFALLLFYGIPEKETSTATVGYISADASALADAGLALPASCTTNSPERTECRVVVTAGESVDPTVPMNALGERFTVERADKALDVVSSVSLFNSDEQELTGWGKVVAFASRVLGTLLLGLAVLAVRNRVKR